MSMITALLLAVALGAVTGVQTGCWRYRRRRRRAR